MVSFLEKINAFVWGLPALLLILGVGLYLTIFTRFAQIRLFPLAIKKFFDGFACKEKNSKITSSFQALCTALAATVGTGNLAGVAGAICIGGPGAVFWMWVSALFGMVTKFAEATLASRFCSKNMSGEKIGGPMYMIEIGMGKRWKWLASIYAFFGIIASFGVGNATQVNTVVSGINQALRIADISLTSAGNLVIGAVLSILILAVLLGGAKRIGRVAEFLVPLASAAYILLGIFAVILNYRSIPLAFTSIIQGAFDPRAVTGGMIGSAFTALRIGTSRGVFTNEAGIGTASIAHAGANVKEPLEQGLMGIIEVFLDTVVICTITALVILCSGVDVCYGVDVGVVLTAEAFSHVFGDWTNFLLAALLCCFAFATILGWGLYGIRCTQYLFGEAAWKRFVCLHGVITVVGAVMGTGVIWIMSDIVNALMAIPNLIALAYLSPELLKLVKIIRA